MNQRPISLDEARRLSAIVHPIRVVSVNLEKAIENIEAAVKDGDLTVRMAALPIASLDRIRRDVVDVEVSLHDDLQLQARSKEDSNG